MALLVSHSLELLTSLELIRLIDVVSQRVPVTEKSGRVHTSAASVAVLPQADEVLKISTFNRIHGFQDY